VALRGGLEALEHAALTLRGLARSVLDSTGIASEASPVRDQGDPGPAGERAGQARRGDPHLRAARPVDPGGQRSRWNQSSPRSSTRRHRLQDELADLLRPQAKAGRRGEWPLRGEILAHVDRLRTGLSVDAIHPAAARPRAGGAVRTRHPGRGPGRCAGRPHGHGPAPSLTPQPQREGRPAFRRTTYGHHKAVNRDHSAGRYNRLAVPQLGPKGAGRPSPPRCSGRRP